MKIICKFKDYYDFAVGYDTDPRKIYIREKTILGKNELIGVNKYKLLYFCDGNLQTVVYEMDRKNTRRGQYYVGCVYFCDIKYPYLFDQSRNTFYYQFEEIPLKIIAEFESLHEYYWRDKLQEYFLFERRWSRKGYVYREISSACNYNKLAGSPVLYSWLNENGEEEFVMNGRLSDIKFAAFKSPQEAYQELYNWIEFKEPITDTAPENMDRFASKGFDKKTSFRNIK